MWKILLSCVALLAFAYVSDAQLTDDEIKRQIDAFVTSALECDNVPGATVAVVRENEVFYTQGYGVKNIDTQEPVTDQSLFVIASTTKAFVATLAGLYLSENEYNWDTSVKDILGDWFHLSDPYRTTMVTTRDLLAHRTNLPRNDPIRIYGYTIRELMERMRFLNYSAEFRDNYQYNNLMYGLASHVTEVLGGKSWEDLTRERLFTPLGMTSTTFAHQADDRLEEFAKSYQWDWDIDRFRELTLEVPKAMYSTIGAPGAITTNAIDMAKWIIMQINEGRAQDNTEVVPRSIIRDTWYPCITTGSTSGYLPTHAVGAVADKYGLGWSSGAYRGYFRLVHSGSIAGYRTQVSFLPDMQIGVFLSFTSTTSIQSYLEAFVMDLMLGYTPWVNGTDFCSLLKTGELHVPESSSHLHNDGHDSGAKANLRQSSISNKDIHLDETKSKALKDTEKSNNDQSDGRKQQKNAKQLTRYVGRFGNYAYGNITTYVNETTSNLMLSYGPGVWEMFEGLDGEFSGSGLEPFWYWTLSVVFDDTTPSTGVSVSFESVPAPPYFLRDLDVDNNIPPPPTVCPSKY